MPPYAIAFELTIYLLFMLCLRHAWRRGAAVVWQLIAGVLFGILLEYATIYQLHTYSYGRFSVMLGPVPLCVGMAWGCIVYAARLVSEGSGLPGWAKPLLAGLFALNIDLSMDAIAIRLGFWHWSNDIHSQFFGVPYGNFWAWFWVVVSFSAGMRAVLALKHLVGAWLAPVGAMIGGLVVVLLTNRVIVMISDVSYALYVLAVALLLGTALLLVLWLHLRRPAAARRFTPSPGLPATMVPLGFHSFFLLTGAISGIFLRAPLLLAVSLSMAGVGVLYIHRGALSSVRGAPD